jgi:UDP-N-acetylglucosamine transferase subunit ALG13
LKLLLAASGGGHLRQLIELRPFWSRHETVIATEDTGLGRSLADGADVRFFGHFAFGQRRTESWWALARAGWRNLVDSWRIVRAVRPEVVISTGAGSAFFVALFGKAMGAELVVIESFARFEGPSLFGRLAGPLADRRIIQSAALQSFWPDATLVDPFRIVEAARPPKTATAVVTVGTVLPFDRLVAGVAGLKADGLLPEAVWAQIGAGGRARADFVAVEAAGFDEMQARLADAELLFTHGGTGSLVTGLKAGCRIVAMPRDPARREHYDDHQMEIVDAFEARGLIAVARETADLPAALAKARAMTVRQATTDYAALVGLLEGWFPCGEGVEPPAGRA